MGVADRWHQYSRLRLRVGLHKPLPVKALRDMAKAPRIRIEIPKPREEAEPPPPPPAPAKEKRRKPEERRKMADVNEVRLVGKVASEPETRETKYGDVTRFRVETVKESKFGNKASFHSVTAWKKVSDACRTLKEGDRTEVVGSLRTRSYEDKSGQKKWITEVVAQTVNALRAAPVVEEEDDDDVPF